MASNKFKIVTYDVDTAEIINISRNFPLENMRRLADQDNAAYAKHKVPHVAIVEQA